MKNNDIDTGSFGYMLMPLIDVMMFVVIIFMLLYYKNNQSLLSNEISIPKSEEITNIELKETMTMVIGIDPEGLIYVKGQQYRLEELVNTILKDLDKKTLIYLQGDAATPYQKVVDVLSTLKNKGFEKIFLLSEKK